MVPGVGSPSRGKHSPQEEPVSRPQDDEAEQQGVLCLLLPAMLETVAETQAQLHAVAQPGAEAAEPAAGARSREQRSGRSTGIHFPRRFRMSSSAKGLIPALRRKKRRRTLSLSCCRSSKDDLPIKLQLELAKRPLSGCL